MVITTTDPKFLISAKSVDKKNHINYYFITLCNGKSTKADWTLVGFTRKTIYHPHLESCKS